ncbi:protein-ADP-ribose hydrolase [Streptomyces griseiscabiei]|uniref:Protein-ADP-ribose hydrolase n=1 Tax=Streptomyces griseiscabiei TaxID=2993540 RepID=A0ABU4L7J8_9ACTN|nr:protein-ADP-ribose hydrolase [Streptomyces griseiscabiei]MBZ3901693.1 protein-ADP-ribose hydrolase [Streptomyces griseiscabiei]MDX2911109.1 protein-ADP-ribose hydrolase [Streptomyces griseiscabiei]
MPRTPYDGPGAPGAGPSALPLAAYRAAIALDEPVERPAPPSDASAEQLDAFVRAALRLLATDPAVSRLGLRTGTLRDLADAATARRVLRALLTVRPPGPLSPDARDAVDAVLDLERRLRPAVDVAELPTVAEEFPHTAYRSAGQMSLWRGDLTTLAADAVVNAANSALLGCFQPLHPCVDNAIHSAAGPRLRDDCHTVVTLQGASEPTGTAKITRGHHLPAAHVLHTVGPVVRDRPTRGDAEALAGAYRACLDLAAEVGTVRTLAFCSVSTGVFGYPKPEAAAIALRTVSDWLTAHPGRLDRVVLNVFAADDEAVYRRTLTGTPTG